MHLSRALLAALLLTLGVAGAASLPSARLTRVTAATTRPPATHTRIVAHARVAAAPARKPATTRSGWVYGPHDPPPLTIASIFSGHPRSLARYDQKNIRTLIATGDVIPARSVNYKMTIYNDFRYPFRRTADFLRTGDITLINLEAPLIAGCPVTDEGMSFCGDPRAVEGLTYAGVDVACTANNHAGNYGYPGINETKAHLEAAGIAFCGWGVVAHKVVRGIRFAFLAFNTVGERFNYQVARQEIRAARKTADVVVVSVHWGKEYVDVPTTAPGIADDDPRKVGHWIIDSGADLVIGNHPHHVQGVEIYHDRLITYAHGNFVFDQMWSLQTRQGVVGVYKFYGRRLVSVQYKPVIIDDYSQPHWVGPAQGIPIIQEMIDSTNAIAKEH